MNERAEAPKVGLTVVHRRYVSYAQAHYAGNLVDGAWGLGLFGDVATEMCIRTDGDEGLFASYSDVQFLAPVRAGDLVEASATLVRVGSRSRELDFALVVVARGEGDVHRRGPDPARAHRGHHGHRHGRRTPLGVTEVWTTAACLARHAAQRQFTKPGVHLRATVMTCTFVARAPQNGPKIGC